MLLLLLLLLLLLQLMLRVSLLPARAMCRLSPLEAAASPDGATKKDKGRPARAVAISKGESSNAYAKGMDHGGDLKIYLKYFDPKFPYDTD